MWYEALPSLLIIGTLMYSIPFTNTLLSKAFFGNPYCRLSNTIWNRSMITRDERVAGDMFSQMGLENIPDD